MMNVDIGFTTAVTSCKRVPVVDLAGREENRTYDIRTDIAEDVVFDVCVVKPDD